MHFDQFKIILEHSSHIQSHYISSLSFSLFFIEYELTECQVHRNYVPHKMIRGYYRPPTTPPPIPPPPPHLPVLHNTLNKLPENDWRIGVPLLITLALTKQTRYLAYLQNFSKTPNSDNNEWRRGMGGAGVRCLYNLICLPLWNFYRILCADEDFRNINESKWFLSLQIHFEPKCKFPVAFHLITKRIYISSTL